MRSVTVIRVLLLAILSIPFVAGGVDAASPRAASGWTQWRGPDRSAVSPETGLLQDWPPEGPRVRWRIPVGAGFSGIAVSGDRLYTAWDDGGMQYLLGLDAATGKEVWRQLLGASFTHPYGDGPRSTPLVDEDRVYAVGTTGRLIGVNRDDGEVAWSLNLVRDLGARLPPYGYSSSPLIAGDRLFLEAGGPDAAFVALDKKNGHVLWKAVNDLPAYSSPIAVTLAGVPQVVFWSGGGLHALRMEDGAELWSFAWKTLCPVSGQPLNTGTPILVGPDRLFIASGSGAAMLRIVQAENGLRAEEVWGSMEMRSDVNTPLLSGGHIYGFDGGILKCLDAETGELHWRARGFQKGSLIAADGRLFVLGETGNLALVEASPDAFVEHGSMQLLHDRSWTAPTLADGRLYVRNQEEMVSVDLRGSVTPARLDGAEGTAPGSGGGQGN